MLYVYRGSRGDFFDRWALYFRWKLAYFFIIGGFGCSTDKKTVKKIFFWKSNNGFPLMALKLTYMWNIVAKLAKLRKSIFSRVTPNTIITSYNSYYLSNPTTLEATSTLNYYYYYYYVPLLLAINYVKVRSCRILNS